MTPILGQRCAASVLVVLLLAANLQAKDARPTGGPDPAANGQVPDFQRHVVPLLGRLGCNGRSCHGSFQGRGGMRLSLFGYDFKMDHAALTAAGAVTDGNRSDRKHPEESLILRKPTLELEHEGGQRFKPSSWEYRILHGWIQAGANEPTQLERLERLEVEPAELWLSAEADSVQLKVTAVWEGGDREDVTRLCRFRTNDDSVAVVDQNGVVKSVGAGDTHVIAFYDNGVHAVPVLRPRDSAHLQGLAAAPDRQADPAGEIDSFVLAKLRKLGIQPSQVCTDAEFLRRVSVDLTGTLPTPEEVTRFLADESADKRVRKIDELLERPAYAAWWANKLCDFTGCNPNQQAELGQETSVQWYMWVYERLRENVPYDEFVRRIVLAKGRRDDQSYDQYTAETSAYFRDQSPADFANRESMPHYWTRRSMQKSEDAAQAFAHNFLGVRLQCAQCHKHPFGPWTQNDFEEFTSFFDNVEFGVEPSARERYRELAKEVGLQVRGEDGAAIRGATLRVARDGRTIPWRELYIGTREQPVTLQLLRSQQVELAADQDPREPIMRWMSQPDNPWFARAFVNRVWAGYFHVGIVDPPDDLNPANPPSHPQLLDWLSSEFVERGYDMKWLHRQIVSSDTYQRSWRPNATNREDRHNFSRSIPRRLPAEVVYDGVKQAVAADEKLAQVRSDLTRRAIGHLSMRLAGTYAMQVFGKPDRAVNCDCERVNQPTLLQSVFLQNDPLVGQRLEDSGWLEEIGRREMAGEPLDHAQLVQAAWLRTLSRPADAPEVERALRHLEAVDSVADGLQDLLWALLNTKEFVLNK